MKDYKREIEVSNFGRSTTNKLLFALFFSALFCFSCTPKKENKSTSANTLFTLLPSSSTGINFENNLVHTEELNCYTYRNFYNGAGVGLGDINNDGLADIFFCGNQQSNKLYLNKGNFHFEDITKRAGVASEGVWSTGVSFADVNGDGLLDIFVCKAGELKGKNRHNELFINNGNLTFTEKAKEYRIADQGLSTHATFFDYDKDGDLDCYLLNNSIKAINNYHLVKDQRNIRDIQGGNKLYRNDRDHFTDVSAQSGIFTSSIGFGLGVSVADLDKDGWEDIYVSNDFFERDYLYLNNHDGTFREALEDNIREISMGSMGADVADLNNDEFPEIFVTEMLPDLEARVKTKISFENWDKYQLNIKNGYYYQFPRNVLQLNKGRIDPDNNAIAFSEIGRLAGVSATDWSWGALMADFDNDGFKDIFVANGIYKDLLDLDYIQFMADPQVVRQVLQKENAVVKKLVDNIPSQPLSNYLFHNNHNLTFTNVAQDWGLSTPSFSNGSAYGDLDNDGDLDLVVNNVNMPSFVYRNEANEKQKDNHYLKFKLTGKDKNTCALGTQITVFSGNQKFYQEHFPIRGFESSMDYGLHFGVGHIKEVDSVVIRWPDSQYTVLKNIKTNQVINLNEQKVAKTRMNRPSVKPATPIFQDLKGVIDYVQVENDFNDFNRDRLIFNMLSKDGPKVCKGDVNGDGLEDIYISGAKDSPGALFLQIKGGKFLQKTQADFEKDKVSEDTDCIFFDADHDGDVDLYVTSGGNEFPETSTALFDRLYINNGKGEFQKSNQTLPASGFQNSSCVKAGDFDNDGDLDLFVGTRLKPFQYGVPVNGYILENDGKGKFTNVTPSVAPQLSKIGMIKDVQWVDIDNDKDIDLVIVGEWMGVKILRNDLAKEGNGRMFKDISSTAGLSFTDGFWNCIESGDFDHDGDIDFVLGNQGLNTRFKASKERPMEMYVGDFDGNGTIEQIMTCYNKDKSYPASQKQDLLMQIPELKKKFLKNEDYKEKTIAEIFSKEQLQRATKLSVYETQSSILINNGNSTFQLKPLPVETQFSTINGILVEDFDNDGHLDILLGGNFYHSKPEVGINDGSYGVLLKGDGKNSFLPVESLQSGFFIKGEIRDILSVKSKNGKLLVVGKNNDSIQVFKY
jgi:enediyne biosynthesis protein E4